MFFRTQTRKCAPVRGSLRFCQELPSQGPVHMSPTFWGPGVLTGSSVRPPSPEDDPGLRALGKHKAWTAVGCR